MGALAKAVLLAGFKVISVPDGDSLNLETLNGQEVRVRLKGVDCPEKASRQNGKTIAEAQKGYAEARAVTNRYTYSKTDKELTIVSIAVDRHGRHISEVYIGDFFLNRHLVAKGLCEYYRYGRWPYNEEFKALEKQAKAKKLGVWGLKGYESPRLFRKKLQKLKKERK